MKNFCRRFLAYILAVALTLTLIPGISVFAEEKSSKEYTLTLFNDCAGAVTYTVEIGDEVQDVTLEAGESREFSAVYGTAYMVTWKEGAEKKYNYTVPEQTVYTGIIGETTETYYADYDGNEYTAEQVSDTVSYTDYSMKTELYAVDTLATFTRSYSWPYYRYTNVDDSTEFYRATGASDARDNIRKTYPESEGWGMAVADEEGSGHTECWVYKTVTEFQKVIAGNSELTVHTDAEPVVQPDVTGEFTVATLNVDGMPKTLYFAGQGVYDLNADGPGSEGSTAIGQYLQNSGYDLVATSENFNYSNEIMAAASNYKTGTIRDNIPENISLGDIIDLLAGNLFPIDTDGLSLLSKTEIPVFGESWTAWNDNYYTDETIFGSITVPSGNGADGMIEKGYRFYQAQIAEGVTVDIYILHADADSQEGDIAARTSQLRQLASAINANTNGNPIIVMGDTNCRYTRDTIKEDLVDATGLTDAWVELIRGDQGYPEVGEPALVAPDKAAEGEVSVPYPHCEVVDKILYMNNPDSPVQLQAVEYNIDTVNYVDDEGALGDHWPVSVKFQYTIEGTDCPGHEYELVETINPTFEEEGKNVYECAVCGDCYEEEIPKLTSSVQQDEYMAVRGQEIQLPVLENDQICSDSLIAQMELIVTDSDGNPLENTGVSVQDNQLLFTPDTAGQQNIYYTVHYTLQDGSGYTVSPAEVKLWIYSAADKTYILSEGGKQIYSDFLDDDVLTIDGMDSEYEVSIESQSGVYGTAVLDAGVLKYTPEKYADGVEKITVHTNIKSRNENLETDLQKQVNIVPDTVVYYDDTFGSNAANTAGNEKVENKTGYGIYFGDNWSTDEGERAENDHSQTVTTTSELGASAEFTFTGSGLDIMSRISGEKTTVTVEVWKANEEEDYTNSNRELVKIVDITSSEGTLYQVPIIHFDMEERSTYYVRITLSPNIVSGDLSWGTLYLDGIRIYGALSQEDADLYYSAEQKETQSEDIRSMLAAGQIVFVNAEQIDNIVTANSLFGTDEKGNQYGDPSVLEDYIKYGPNNEVYLQNSNGLAFYVTLDEGVKLEDAMLKIQARMPEGNRLTGTVKYAASETESVSFDVTGTTAGDYVIDLDKCVKKGDGTYLIVMNTTGDNIVSIESIQSRGLTIHTGTEETEVLQACEAGPYIRMLSGTEEKAVLNVTIKSIFGRTLGTVTLESEDTGMRGETYVFSGRDVYRAVRNKGYYVLNLLIRLKDYEVDYGETKEITVR